MKSWGPQRQQQNCSFPLPLAPIALKSPFCLPFAPPPPPPPPSKALLLPVILANAAAGVHAILYLYFVVKFGWSAVTIGLFFSVVGLVVAVTQGVLLPALVPTAISPRTCIPVGLAIHAFQYLLYALCDQGWGLVVIMAGCCLQGLEPPSLHALLSSQVGAAFHCGTPFLRAAASRTPNHVHPS